MTKPIYVLTLFMLATACSSTPPKNHEYSLLLDALPASGDTDVEKTETLKIGRVDLPEFLQTRALAMQVARNEVVLARHHSWADRLDDSIAGVLDLALVGLRPQLSTSNASDTVCQLELHFDRFHAAAEGEVLASGHYLLGVDSAFGKHSFDVSRTLVAGGYANAVSELRLSLHDLASEIDDAITAVGGCVATAPAPANIEADAQGQP